MAETGMPINITTSSATLNAPGNGDRPNVRGKPEIFGKIGGQLFFDVTQFTAPAPSTFGNAGRNLLTGPGLFGLDFSVFRRFRLSERMNLELRCEAFNLTNTPHFDNPSGDLTSASFGPSDNGAGQPGGATEREPAAPGESQVMVLSVDSRATSGVVVHRPGLTAFGWGDDPCQRGVRLK